MTSFENVVVIERPRDEVFAFLADLENVPRWNPAIEGTMKTTYGPVRVGTTYRQVRSAPKRSEESFEITALDPPRRLVIEGDIGPFQARIGYALETVPEGTRLTKWVELEPSSIISRVMVPLAASQIRAAAASNLERLKSLLEDTRRTD